MTGSRLRPAYFVGLFLALLVVALQGVQSEEELEVPPEDLCRPYIEKALKHLGTGSLEQTSTEAGTDADKSHEEGEEGDGKPASEYDAEPGTDGSREDVATEEEKQESVEAEGADSTEQGEEESATASAEAEQSAEADETEEGEAEKAEEQSAEADEGTEEEKESVENVEGAADSEQDGSEEEKKSGEEPQVDEEAQTEDGKSDEEGDEQSAEEAKLDEEKSDEAKTEEEETDSKAEETEEVTDAASKEDDTEDSKAEEETQSQEQPLSEEEEGKEGSEGQEESAEGQVEKEEEEEEVKESEEAVKSTEDVKSAEEAGEESKSGEEEGKSREEAKSDEEEAKLDEEEAKSRARREVGEEDADEASKETAESEEEEEPTPEEDLIQEIEVPENLRPREHINQLLKLDEENEDKERAIEKIADVILKDLKKVYDNAIQPLESLYKYRDLSNRHFGDPEIFSKPLILFMGPWSGGKSSIINYLLDIEYKQTSLRTGAEPSPAYFNILMHGDEEEILDGTQLAADWTFSGLQKFGQGLLDRLKGLRLDDKLLKKVNIVEIPGILEIRKQVQRLFPFNDACQWFIDRADIIFLVYDPSKLDVGPETEAILDQLKGREHQTRIILNKADQVKPEELMRVQGALIWNISPLMSSAEPPVMYSASLWSLPYEAGAPTRLLYAQERAFLRDLRTAIDKRVEHKIASARRFAVRVRNHAKMVDCYLTTYYNHKTFFANKKEISDKIIENPQDYHIYEGLSTLKNISRYDLPDPDVYRDFFRLNPLYDFPLLSSTCTYFRGCPINRLDVAIAYDLPELVGKYRKSVEQVIHEYETNPSS
ncbi:sarcalumenin isoform X2 [Osmia lignaria lignaria]|uniref:sarcalumenin isoform X2 n=1 Tax=Osmia lignaria lignaria TaxID=1437193 RepID=UPI00402B57D6